MAILLIGSLIFSDYIKLGQARYSDFLYIVVSFMVCMLHVECDAINLELFYGVPTNHSEPSNLNQMGQIYLYSIDTLEGFQLLEGKYCDHTPYIFSSHVN